MKIGKLKILLMFVYCFLALWSGTQCMEAAERQLTLVGENHSTVGGMGYCYQEIEKFVKNNPQQELNFLVEKDEIRLKNAFCEVNLLKPIIEKYIKINDINKVMWLHIKNLEEEYPSLYKQVYTNIISSHKRDGLIKNRFYFLTIIKKFKDHINIIPIDGSFEQVTNHPKFQKVRSSNSLIGGYYEAYKAGGASMQTSIDNIMRTDQVISIRDQIMINTLNSQIRSNTRNLAIVGEDHVDKIKRAMEQEGIKIESISGSKL